MRKARTAALVLALLCCGCDNTLTPFADEPEVYFGVYGYLDMAADTQFVRVNALRPNILDPTLAAPLDAVVTTTDEEQGTVVVWQDSVVTLDDGTFGHLFFARFDVRAGATYRLEVRRPDGRTTTATTNVPPAPSLDVGAVLGDVASLSQQVTLLGVPVQPWRLQMYYTVAEPGETPATFEILYGNAGRSTINGWQVEIFLKRDQKSILRSLNRNQTDTSVLFFGLEIEVQEPNAVWDNPALSQVEHGHGFFAAMSRVRIPWELTADEVEALGFTKPPS